MKYKDVKAELKKLNIKFSEKIFALIGAFLFGLLIISAPLALLVNFGIFINYLHLLIFIGAILVLFIFFFIQLIYYNAISQGEIKGTYIVALGDTIIPAIILLALLLLFFHLGVI